jgi:hypothetical protein
LTPGTTSHASAMMKKSSLPRLAESIIRTGQTISSTVAEKPEGILDAARKMADLLGRNSECLTVVAAHLDVDAVVSLEKAMATPRWEIAENLKTNWVLGLYDGCPAIHLNDLGVNGLYVVDIPRVGCLVQYVPLVDLRVSSIDEVSAKQLIRTIRTLS